MNYQPIDRAYFNFIRAVYTNKKYCTIQYFTAIHEFISVNSIISKVYEKDDAEYIALVTGEHIRMDRVIRVNEQRAPGYRIDDFTCDC